MAFDVFLVVLGAALLHAGWNTLLKLGRRAGAGGAPVDPMLGTLLLGLAASAVSLPGLLASGLPQPVSWRYAFASAVIHIAYYLLVGAAYRAADLSAQAWVGVVAIGAGVAGLASVALRRGGLSWAGFGFAAGNAGVVMLYTLVDGHGARLSRNPAGYTMLIEVLCFPMLFAALALVLRGEGRIGPALRAALGEGRWWRAILGAAMSIAAYAAALWAMTRAPIGAVAALREVSVLLGVLFGALVLRETVGAARWTAAGVIVAGAMLVRLG